MRVLLLSLLCSLAASTVHSLPLPSVHLLTQRSEMQICGIDIKSSSYSDQCKSKSGYVYVDPDPTNTNGRLKKTTGKWQGNPTSDSRDFECDHLVEAQWLKTMIAKKYSGVLPEGSHDFCRAMQETSGAALRDVMNGPKNMWGVPTGVNQMKRHSTKDPNWKKWAMKTYSVYNFNKAREGVVLYLGQRREDSKTVVGQVYDALNGYDSASFPKTGEDGRAAWIEKIDQDYTEIIATLSDTKLVTKVQSICKDMNPAGDPKKKAAAEAKAAEKAAKKAQEAASDETAEWCGKDDSAASEVTSSTSLTAAATSATRSVMNSASGTGTQTSSATSVLSGSSASTTRMHAFATTRLGSKGDADADVDAATASPSSLRPTTSASRASLLPTPSASSAPSRLAGDASEQQPTRSSLRASGALPSPTRHPAAPLHTQVLPNAQTPLAHSLVSPGAASKPTPLSPRPLQQRPSPLASSPRPQAKVPAAPLPARPLAKPSLSSPPTRPPKAKFGRFSRAVGAI